jgi:actinorhodin biosynthesis protein ActVIA
MRSKAMLAVGLGGLVLALAAMQAQRKDAKTPTLTAMDYVQIRQLVARYAYALDTGANNGYEYADLFAPDGEFVRPPAKGREQLAALARGGSRGPLNTVHYMMNLVVEPSPEGAVGKQYLIELNFDENVPPTTGRSQWNLVGEKRGEVLNIGGHYEDAYVKTQQGWRFKRRDFIPSKSGVSPSAGKKAHLGSLSVNADRSDNQTAPNGSLSAIDYIQIEQLVASYGHALDSGFGQGDNGDAYAGLYTKDGVAFNRTRGYDALAALAREQPRGPNYVRHYLTNHVIEPSAEGAVGKAYLVVIDIGENGKSSSLFLGGHYEDTYVRTPEGWRIKTRVLLPPRRGPQPAQSSSR